MAKQDVELQFRLIDGVTRSLASIQQGVSGLGASILKVNAAAELTGKAFSAIGGAAAALGGLVTGAAEVEDALARVRDITGATAEEQQALQAAIRGAVESTRFSAQEAAQALVLLAEDGFSASAAAAELGRVLAFAQGNAQGAAQATSALGAVLDTFGESSAKIGELADALTATARAAGVSTSALQEGLAQAGVAAEQAGLSVQQTVAALGALAARGIEGGRAGQQLSVILQELQNPASQAGRALEELGLRGASFEQVLASLSRNSAGAERVLSGLGNRPRAALRALLQEGGGDLQRFSQVIAQSAGASQRAADVLNDTFAGALDRIRNQLGLVRDEFAAPLLQPIAAEIEALSQRLIAFANTPEFERLIEQFGTLASQGIKAIGDLVEQFDFTEAVNATVQFADAVVENLETVASVAKVVTDTIGTAFDVLRGGTSLVAGALANAGSKWASFVQSFGIPAENLQLLFDDIADNAKKLGDESLASLEQRFLGTGKAADKAGTSFADAGSKARSASTDLKALALSLAPAEFRVVTEAVIDYAESLREIPPAAKLSVIEQQAIGDAARETAGSLAQLEAELRNVRQQLSQAQIGSPEFERLAAQSRVLGERVAEAREKVDAATASFRRIADGAAGAAGGLREFSVAADSAAASADRVRDSNSAVADSFGNIGRNTSEVAVSFGNLSEEFIRQALNAAGAAKSARDYLDTLNRFLRYGQERAAQVDREIERLQELLELQDEDAKLKAQVVREFGTESVRIEELVRLRKRLAEIQRRNIEDNRAERESLEQLEAAQARSAGGIGGRVGAPGVSPSADAQGGSSVKTPVEINVTINGLPDDRGGWDEIVRDRIAPALERIGRLAA